MQMEGKSGLRKIDLSCKFDDFSQCKHLRYLNDTSSKARNEYEHSYTTQTVANK